MSPSRTDPLDGSQAGERLSGTIAACILAYQKGGRIFRVHDVGPVVQALDVTRAILGNEAPGEQDRTHMA